MKKFFTLTLFFCLIACTSSSYDIIIINGQIADGTGKELFQSNIYIKNGKIIEIGNKVDAIGKTTLNAKGLIIAPGFIDMHSHSDLALLTEPTHIAKVSQGVTTEALGMDGLSYAPISQEKLGGLIQYLVAVNGHAPPNVQWSSVKEFLDLFDNRTSCNIVYFVPHAALRIEAMGWEARPANSDELKKMQQLVTAN